MVLNSNLASNKYYPLIIDLLIFVTAYTKGVTLDYILNGNSMKVFDPFNIGAGYADPLKAMDPGLVYEMKTTYYILFLCNIGYNQ